MQQAWTEEKLADILLMNLKGAFDHVSRNCLLNNMESIGVNEDLMRRTELFMSYRSVGLVINGHQCMDTEVEKGVLQG